MARIVAALVASACFLTLTTVPTPANAAHATYRVMRGGDGWCC